MSTTHSNKVQNVSFDVLLDDSCKNDKTRVPKRLLANNGYKLSADQLQIKQQEAEKRRQACKDYKLAQIKQRQEQCRVIAAKMKALLDLDAKRKGLPGTESVPSVSRRHAGDMIKSVADDFKGIGITLTNDVTITDS
ncbi:uncharacterized protein [Antedon mediterranea]|uniref:uncharacterized protein n=1 Tax=Antedon mediterranea TaxID=105859 RepID=UPI003AF7CEB2